MEAHLPFPLDDFADLDAIAQRAAVESGPCITRPMTPPEREKWPPMRPTRDELKLAIGEGLTVEAIAEKYETEPRRVWMLARRNNLIEKLEVNAKKAGIPMYSPELKKHTPSRTSQILAPDMLRRQQSMVAEMLPTMRRIVKAARANDPAMLTAEEREFADLIGELAVIAQEARA